MSPATPRCLRINLWSGPRNVSTAILYAFAQRADTRAVDEPLYGHYLKVSGAPHPGAAQVLAAMDCNGPRVVRNVILGPCDRPVLFVKNMAHHLVGLPWDFLSQTANVLLTRDPWEVLPSLAQHLKKPTLRDAGYAIQVELLEVLSAQGDAPPVLDARQLLLNPQRVLARLCEHLGLAFEERMLHWPAGPKPEDGVWAPHWYHNVHRSTGFAPYRPKSAPFPKALKPLLAECLPYYEKLSKHAILAA